MSVVKDKVSFEEAVYGSGCNMVVFVNAQLGI